jgi:hypothetical protein
VDKDGSLHPPNVARREVELKASPNAARRDSVAARRKDGAARPMKPVLPLLVPGLLAAFLAWPSQASAADAHSVHVRATDPRMQQIFAADQADRHDEHNVDFKVVAGRDAERRAATHKLLDEGALHTAGDYAAAAFVYQHGGSTDDYLLAHVLAMTAVAKGDRDSQWIAAASLDRYLMTSDKSQVFGTQFTQPKATGGWTQEPYDRALISDALRVELGVPTQPAQAKQLADIQARSRPAAAVKP